ncbi:MAG: hypothetical protein ACR2KO_03000 [Geodermatophilaceae bacterium]
MSRPFALPSAFISHEAWALPRAGSWLAKTILVPSEFGRHVLTGGHDRAGRR